MHLQSSTLKFDENGKPFHIQQAEQIRLYKEAWKKAGHQREPRVSVSRSIFALMNDQDRYLFGQQANSTDKIGMIEADKRAIFGKSYAGEPDQLIKELAQDEAIREADTLLLTIPNTLGVEYNVHILTSILKYVAPGLGWR
jgi:alkanesulfonate monooxygenase SsuD/methylene tetrahydromethanopterin reductase-like flavin-dependent oxidoreductase (luciferase family)